MSAAVGVIVSTFNRAHLLPRALASIFRQTFTDWRCYVVSDGSTDGTIALMDELVKAFPERITFVQLPRNHGWDFGGTGVYARDIGIERSDEPVLAFLDDDNAWKPKHLETCMRVWNRSHKPPLGLTWTKTTMCRDDTGEPLLTLPWFEAPTLGSVDTSAMMVCRNALKGIGGWKGAYMDLVRQLPGYTERCGDFFVAESIRRGSWTCRLIDSIDVIYYERFLGREIYLGRDLEALDPSRHASVPQRAELFEVIRSLTPVA